MCTGVQRHVSGLLPDEKYFVDPATESRLLFPSPFAEPTEKKDQVHLSVIFPAYNEEERMPGTIEETLTYLKKRQQKTPSFTWEIIIVDDGSRDSTYSVRFRARRPVPARMFREEVAYFIYSNNDTDRSQFFPS